MLCASRAHARWPTNLLLYSYSYSYEYMVRLKDKTILFRGGGSEWEGYLTQALMSKQPKPTFSLFTSTVR